MKIQFNTGRRYSEYWQRIIAVQDGDGIRFNDIDRHIPGKISLVRGIRELDRFELENFVMTNYDLGNYIPLFFSQVEDLAWEE